MSMIWIGIGLSGALAIEPVSAQGGDDAWLEEGNMIDLSGREDSPWAIINGEEAIILDCAFTAFTVTGGASSLSSSSARNCR